MSLSKTEITLKYLKRYPQSARTKSFSASRVHIKTDKGFWQVDCAGYTFPHYADAGVFGFEDASRIISGLGAEKRAALVRVREYWTDYPILDLGDRSGELARVRRIVPIWYDGDKYVSFRLFGGRDDIYDCKAGYIYAAKGRLGEVPQADCSIFKDDKLMPK